MVTKVQISFLAVKGFKAFANLLISKKTQLKTSN